MKIRMFVLMVCLLGATGCKSLLIGGGAWQTKEISASWSQSQQHIGIVHSENKRFAGWVSNKSGKESQALITRFHDLLWLKEYHEAYRIFSDELKKEISYEEFLQGLKALDEDYGEEFAFIINEDPLTERVVASRKTLFQDAHDYYDAVISSYNSQRRKDLTFSFGVSRYAYGRLKICFYGYFLPKEGKSIEYSAIPRKGNIQDKEFIEQAMVLMD